MLHKWVERSGEAATGNALERALKQIGREDIVNKCIYNVEHVTDDTERKTAKARLAGLRLLANYTYHCTVYGLSLIHI